MIITNENKQVVEGDDFHVVKSKVNASKLAKLYGLLSNIYKNPIGSIVREYSSNAYDANREAYTFGNSTYNEVVKKYPWVLDPEYGIKETEFLELKNNLTRVKENEPIVVGIAEKANRLQFFVKDFGIGLSPARMNNIFFDYLSSTKEDTDDEIGGFGIGAKSALSIFKEFYIDTIYNGVQYQYMMGKDEKGIPEGTLLYQSEFIPDIENGTKISMYIDDSQINSFVNEMSKQLAYLNNVYFNFEDVTNSSMYRYNFDYRTREKITDINDFKIYDFGKWYRRTNPPLKELHMSIGNICYPIDFNELQVDRIEEPFCLKFDIGELQPTPSRESIMYSDKAKALIKERIKELQEHYIEKLKATTEDTDDIQVFIDRFKNTHRTYEEGDKFTVNIEKLLGDDFDNLAIGKTDYIPFKNIGLKLPSSFSLNYLVECNSKILRTARKRELKSWEHPIFYTHLNFILASDSNDRAKIGSSFRRTAYLIEDILDSSDDIYIFEISNSSVEHLCSYYLNSSSPNYQKKLNEFKKAFLDTFIPYLKSFAIDYHAYEPTPTWDLKYDAGYSRFSIKKKVKRVGSIPATYYNMRHDEWNRNTFKLIDLDKYKGILIYGTGDDKNRMQAAAQLLKTDEKLSRLCRDYQHNGFKYPIMTLCVSKDNFKIMKEMENAKTVDEAILEIKTFKRIVTARKIHERFTDVRFLNKICYMNDELKSHYLNVETFMDRNNTHRILNGEAGKLLEDAIKVAEAHNLFDSGIIQSLEFLEKYAQDIGLIKYISIDSGFDAQKDLSTYLMTDKKKRIKPEFYPSVL